jgi:hypothetical protein
MILDKLKKKKGRDERSLYFCNACDGYHLTSK